MLVSTENAVLDMISSNLYIKNLLALAWNLWHKTGAGALPPRSHAQQPVSTTRPKDSLIDMDQMYFVSSPHKGKTHASASEIADAVRLLTQLRPRAIQSPSAIAADAGRDWDASEYEAIGSESGDLACLLGGIERRVQDVGFARADDDDRSHLPGFQLYAHRDTVRPRKPLVNKDKAYRDRAKLREEYRNDPAAFVSKIPGDVFDRIAVRDQIAEAHALLDAVNDARSATAWLDALSHKDESGHHGPEEHARLVNYEAPTPRLRSRPIAGIVAMPREDGTIAIALRMKELPRHPRVGLH